MALRYILAVAMTDTLKYRICLGCGFAYDEALGLAELGLPAGTRWRDRTRERHGPAPATGATRCRLCKCPARKLRSTMLARRTWRSA